MVDLGWALRLEEALAATCPLGFKDFVCLLELCSFVDR